VFDRSDAQAQPELLRSRGSNNGDMRLFNERVILQAVRLHGSLAKAELARLTGLSAQAIGLITERLANDGLLIKQDRVRGRIGQPSVPLALNPDGAFAIGINIGRRRTDWLLVDFNGAVRRRLSVGYPFPNANTLFPLLAQRMNVLRDGLGGAANRLIGVGVAAPFQLGGWHRLLGLSSATSDGWNRLSIQQEVQAMTELPVSFAKDTCAACVAELVKGRGRDLKSFLYLFVDTFVGGGLVLDSRLRQGVHGNAGAVASLPLGLARRDSSAEQLVNRASLWQLEQRFRHADLDPQAAYDERALQAPWARHTSAWVKRAAAALAQCIVSGTAFLDLDAIVLDGSFAPTLLDAVLAATERALLTYNWEGLSPPQLHRGSIGSDARALGGALLPLHADFSPDSDVFIKQTPLQTT
jgi:predicted NBD/HSP70 family sugar kinase